MHRVLIETYWNVNMVCVLLKDLPTPVLIETYWNVNTKNGTRMTFAPVRINRNILECKL